jgi:hypothetical protein
MTTSHIEAIGEEVHESQPKQRSDNNNGYMYLPRDWLGETILLLLSADTHETSEQGPYQRVEAKCADYSRPKVYEKGTGAACYVYQDHVETNCIAILDPQQWTVTKQ